MAADRLIRWTTAVAVIGVAAAAVASCEHAYDLGADGVVCRILLSSMAIGLPLVDAYPFCYVVTYSLCVAASSSIYRFRNRISKSCAISIASGALSFAG